MDAVWLLIGIFAGAGVMWVALRPAAREDARAVRELVGPLSEQLGQVDTRLRELDRQRAAARGELTAQLRQLGEAGDRLRQETGALVGALRRPNGRGQWGQMQLRRVVELAGMVEHVDFSEQVALPGEERSLRPDMVVRLPGERHVVIDAKAPLQAMLDAYEARDEEARRAALRDHARLLRTHVAALAAKAYWRGLATAPDFVVLFLPGEHLYSAALEADPSLVEEAIARRVLIATPTTLVAMLHAVAHGWRQERIAQSAQAVADAGRELHGRLARLARLLAAVGTRLESTVRAYNAAAGSYEARVLPAARRLAEHAAVPGAGGDDVAPPPVTTAPRPLASGQAGQDVPALRLAGE